MNVSYNIRPKIDSTWKNNLVKSAVFGRTPVIFGHPVRRAASHDNQIDINGIFLPDRRSTCPPRVRKCVIWGCGGLMCQQERCAGVHGLANGPFSDHFGGAGDGDFSSEKLTWIFKSKIYENFGDRSNRTVTPIFYIFQAPDWLISTGGYKSNKRPMQLWRKLCCDVTTRILDQSDDVTGYKKIPNLGTSLRNFFICTL